MNLFFLATATLLVLPSPVLGLSCSFTRNFGDGAGLSSSGLEAFNAGAGSTTTCSLSCDEGSVTSLWLKYGDTPNLINKDGDYLGGGCEATLAITSYHNEYQLGYDIKSAVYRNLSLTCTCDSVGPAAPSWSDLCFSERTTVDTLHHGKVAIKDLPVGEQVLVGYSTSWFSRGIYEPVYSLGHLEQDKEATFLQLYTSLAPREPLELSEGHLVYKIQGSGQPVPVRADMVKVDDNLLYYGSSVAVTKISRIVRPGRYMPLTPSGSIVVNGVQSSAYVSIQEWAPSVTRTVARLGFSEHQLVHWWLAPYRFVCMGLSKQFCGQRDKDNGILEYLVRGKELAKMAEGYNGLVQALVFGPPLFLVFGFFHWLEYPFGPSMAPIVLAMVMSLVWYMKASRKEAGRSQKRE
jgi:Hint module